jgi:hypothetical protein
MASGAMIYLPNFMMISPGIQVTLRLLPHTFRVFSVDIMDERVLLNMPLIWPHLHKLHKYRFSLRPRGTGITAAFPE